jgi:intracellular multiplication protein IcmP
MNERIATPQNGSSGDDAMMSVLLLIAVGAGGCWFLWHRYHAEISYAVLAAQHWQMVVIGYFTDRYTTLDEQARSFAPASITFHVLYQFCHMVGLFFRIPAAIFIGVLAALCLVQNAPSRFTTTLTLDRLMKVQSGAFRTTAAFVGRGLKPKGVADGEPRPLDPALHAKEWIKRYAVDRNGRFAETQAAEELTRQLGGLWTKADGASGLERSLLAAFALHGLRERDAAEAFLGEFAEAMAAAGSRQQPEGPAKPLPVPPRIVAAADVVLRRQDVRAFLMITNKHAYTASALMTVVMVARRRAGVLAPAQFNFIKMIDRRLWYALHSLGFPGEAADSNPPMPNPRIEAAGAHDHWAAECAEGHPLHIPSIGRAMLAVRAAAAGMSGRA